MLCLRHETLSLFSFCSARSSAYRLAQWADEHAGLDVR